MRPRISIRGYVRRSVGPSVGRSVTCSLQKLNYNVNPLTNHPKVIFRCVLASLQGSPLQSPLFISIFASDPSHLRICVFYLLFLLVPFCSVGNHVIFFLIITCANIHKNSSKLGWFSISNTKISQNTEILGFDFSYSTWKRYPWIPLQYANWFKIHLPYSPSHSPEFPLSLSLSVSVYPSVCLSFSLSLCISLSFFNSILSKLSWRRTHLLVDSRPCWYLVYFQLVTMMKKMLESWLTMRRNYGQKSKRKW